MLSHAVCFIRNRFICSIELTDVARLTFRRNFTIGYKNRVMSNYYAVARGRQPGVYFTWDECQQQTKGFSGAAFKKFKSQDEALSFVETNMNQKKGIVYTSTSHQMPDEVFALGKENSRASTSSQKNSKRKLYATSTFNQAKKQKVSNNARSEDVPGCKESRMFQNVNCTVDNEGYVEVFTDGACSSNGRNGAKAGIGVWFGDDHPLNLSEPVIGRATNNHAEIKAVTAAVKQAQKVGIEKLKINTDSQFVINCVTNWMKKWKRNGWRTASGENVKNKNELIELDAALATIDASWNHVRGHTKIPGNEGADKLAKDGSSLYKK